MPKLFAKMFCCNQPPLIKIAHVCANTINCTLFLVENLRLFILYFDVRGLWQATDQFCRNRPISEHAPRWLKLVTQINPCHHYNTRPKSLRIPDWQYKKMVSCFLQTAIIILKWWLSDNIFYGIHDGVIILICFPMYFLDLFPDIVAKSLWQHWKSG